MKLQKLSDPDVDIALNHLDMRHPLQSLALVDAIPFLRIFTKCCGRSEDTSASDEAEGWRTCLTRRRYTKKGPKKVEDWLK